MQITAQILELDQQRSQVVTKIQVLLNELHNKSDCDDACLISQIDFLYKQLEELDTELTSC